MITNLQTGMINKPLSTKEWAIAVSRPKAQVPVQTATQTAPVRATPAPTAPIPTQQSSSILQRALSGEFGAVAQQLTQAKQNAEIPATVLGASSVTVPNVGGVMLPVRAPVPTPTQGGEQVLSHQQAIQQRMLELFQDGQDFDAGAIMDAEQVYEKEAKVRILNEEYDRMALDQRRTIDAMRENPEGKLAGALNADIQNYQYISGQALLDQEMRLHYASGNYDMAYRRAQEAIDAQNERYNKSMDFYKTMYGMLQDDMTESEKMAYGSQLRMYEQETSYLMEAKNLAMQRASQSGAPDDVLIGIKNAQSPSEIWSIAGKYGEDPEMAMRREQFGEEMKLAWSKHEWDRWATTEQMRISQMQRSAEITEKEAQAEIAQVQAQQEAGNIISSLNNLASNTLGMKAMTGATSGVMSQVGGFFRGALTGGVTGAGVGAIAGAPVAGVGAIPSAAIFGIGGAIGGGFAGRKQVAEAQTSFANDMDFVTSGNIINKLKDIRASGSWSGPMTDRDIEIIGQASNKLNAMWDKEKRVFKGTANESEVNAEIAKIQGAMSRIIVPKGEDDELSKIFK